MNEVVAKRYGEALFQLATEKGITEQLISELGTVKAVFEEDKQLLEFLNHPRINLQKKKELIDVAFKSFNEIVLNTLKLLVERHRISNIVAIVNQFNEFYNEANGIATATVYSVRPLSDGEKASLEESFKKNLNKKSVTFINEIDPNLIGGIKIRVGNTIYDGSISGKLNRVKLSLTSANL